MEFFNVSIHRYWNSIEQKKTNTKTNQIKCDGQNFLEKIQELKCHSIIFLNIPSFAGGRKPWKNGEEGYERQSYSDGMIEILGFHTAGFVSRVFLLMFSPNIFKFTIKWSK